MFTREEKKQLRMEYWNRFKTYSNRRKLKKNKPGKWIMEETGIKQLKLKFHFDETHAWAGIEIDTRNLDKRIELFDKLEKLKSVLTNRLPHQLHWELEKAKTENKSVSRIFAELADVNIYHRQCWKQVNDFLYEVMDPIEDIFKEYFDFIKYQ
ncbi:MAG TPA: hypothetical protein DDX98_13540 [Bacteroidales bacterium]|jgi:hypothetical protein|nr:hypothetical protein [Bacteroidales bacterium]